MAGNTTNLIRTNSGYSGEEPSFSATYSAGRGEQSTGAGKATAMTMVGKFEVPLV